MRVRKSGHDDLEVRKMTLYTENTKTGHRTEFNCVNFRKRPGKPDESVCYKGSWAGVIWDKILSDDILNGLDVDSWYYG